MTNFDEASRQKWRRSIPTIEDLHLGCLQRVADATELMAKSHAQLITERNNFKESKEMWQRLYAAKLRQVSSLRGVITKLKNKHNR